MIEVRHPALTEMVANMLILMGRNTQEWQREKVNFGLLRRNRLQNKFTQQSKNGKSMPMLHIVGDSLAGFLN